MAGRIPSAFIDELINRVDIVEVIDSRVPLKKAGREYEACCPFHNEKTPSFKVNPQKQFYHCFGCKAGGSAITFLMEYDHLDFVEAVEELAKIAGVEVPREQSSHYSPEQRHEQKQVKTNLYDLMAHCDRFYRQQLRQHPKAQIAIDYLKGRGLSGEIAARYNLGYAPPGNNLERATPNQANNLVTTGMLIRKDNGETYDRFRHRVMFPIRDSRGRVIAFGGRIIPEQGQNTDNQGPKYLNSPETPLFHKGRELYGLYEVRQALRHIPRLLVVEGYMDVIALAQQGIDYAVATLGTACTAEHIQKLFRLCHDVVFCFDGDRAGHEAAWRALENTLPSLQGTQQIRFLFLPDGEDPDSMVRKIGKQAFEEKIEQAQSLSQYFFDHLREGIGRHDLEAHRTLIEKARPYLQGMADAAYQSLLVRELASYTQKDEREIYGLVGIAAKTHSGTKKPAFSTPNSHNTAAMTPSLVRTAIRCLLHSPELAETIEQPQTLSQIDQPGVGLLVDLLENIKSNPTLNTAALLERWRDRDEGKHLAKLATWQPPLNDPEFLQQEFLGAIERLQAKHLSARTDTLLAKANQGNLSPDEKSELQSLLSRTPAKDPVQS
jgi:DNA primase